MLTEIKINSLPNRNLSCAHRHVPALIHTHTHMHTPLKGTSVGGKRRYVGLICSKCIVYMENVIIKYVGFYE